jgi:hypothetical protein
MKHDFVSGFILVWNACSILACIVLINQLLLVLSYDIPIGGMLDIENQIPTEYQLARGTT